MSKIIHVIDGLGIGGAERMLVDLVTCTDRSVHDVQVVYLNPKHDALVAALQSVRIRTTCIPKKSKIGLGLYRHLRQFFAAEKPDIVHTHLFASDVWGTIAAVDAGVPHIVSTEHNINRAEGRMKHLLKNHARKNQQAIVAVSHAVEKAVIAEAGEAISKKVSVIYNAVDTSRFSPPFEPRRNPQPLVAVVGRLVEQKGHLQLLRVLRSVQTPFRAHIVGSGELHSAIQKRINDLGLSEVIQMQPARADIQVVYKEADVVIIPSEWEGFGLVAIEAMSSGCTVVAANVDGLMEVVQNGVNGVVTDMHQISQAAAAIDSVLAYPDVRAQYGRAAREFASTHFTMREMGNSYMQWYNTILAQKIA